jgi:hypothetical protein
MGFQHKHRSSSAVEFHNSEEEEGQQQQQQEQQQKQKPVRQRALRCNEGRIRISLGKQI